MPERNKENNILLKTFYEDIQLVFNSNKEKNSIQNIFQDFEKELNFTCDTLFELNREKIQKIENNTSLKNVTYNLISLCEFLRVTGSNDYRTVFQRLFQNIKNGIVLITDFKYEGLIKYIKTEESLGRISLFFDTIVISVIKIAFSDPYKKAIENLIKLLKELIQLSLIIFLLCDIIAILFVKFLYEPGINKLCNQIFVLRKVFKIYEIQE